jgi:hypothetical protein
MTVARGFVITISAAMIFAIFGGLAGSTLGWLAPDYYRIVFNLRPDTSFNSVQLGLGLGVTQGFGAGLVVGLAIVLIVAWINSRTATTRPS